MEKLIHKVKSRIMWKETRLIIDHANTTLKIDFVTCQFLFNLVQDFSLCINQTECKFRALNPTPIISWSNIRHEEVHHAKELTKNKKYWEQKNVHQCNICHSVADSRETFDEHKELLAKLQCFVFKNIWSIFVVFCWSLNRTELKTHQQGNY